MGRNNMTKSDAGRIQAGQAKGGHDMSSGSFAARAQAAGDRNQAAMAAASRQNTGSGAGTQTRGTNGGGGSGKK
ncbi:uncharacterized protein F4822DRAFT_432727 [Hypoxylon trugodes]|uniref:uncharacterized protein n=1 Tax=Hypoxylon trugodes TaxID=326681 RepID=UPI00218CE086|nr:uncharacterized protein F4822DRAFT_432727 [Hypoxylon trugodes]KAI1385867.1 hypothetical protein F4822DRAFT_432727 [Hypoxylon trugodes]